MICCLLCLFLVCQYLDTFDFPFGLSEFYTDGAYFLNDYSWSRIQGLQFSTLPNFSGFIQDFNNIARLNSPHCTQLIVLIRNAFCRCFLAVSCDLMSVVLRLCVFSPTFRDSNVSLDSSTNNSVGILFSLLNITSFGVIPVLSWTLAL